MKKIITLLLSAGLIFGICKQAPAIDFKLKGQWIMSFDYGQNGKFTGGGGLTGYNSPKPAEDDFEARQRLRLVLEAVASESLSGTVGFEIGESFWGKASEGAALGADGTIIKLRWAYLDWMMPDIQLKTRMGISLVRMPNFTTGSMVLNDDCAGIISSYTLNENIALTGFWLRPLNDNFPGYSHDGLANYRQNFMDNMDMFGLVIPLTFDKLKLTPWGMIGGIGPNTFRRGDNYVSESANWGQGRFAEIGLIPAGGAMHRDGTSARNVTHPTAYATAWWAGLGGQIDYFEPFRVSFDFNYGSVTWPDAGRMNRSGFLATLLLEYKLDWGIPGLLGWYGSGDDSNPANGSERMPSISCNAANRFSHFAFKGEPNIARGGVIGRSMSGTWGVGARLKDMSFVENLKHTLRVNVIGGTNSPSMAKKMSINGMAANGMVYGEEQWGTDSYPKYGRDEMYLTTDDVAVEFGIRNEYKMYENFNIILDANYITLDLDKSNSVWGLAKMNGKTNTTKDAWNINMAFVYQF